MTAETLVPLISGESNAACASGAHVVVLMNFVPPHRVPILSELAKRVKKLTLLLSTPMEPNRSWSVEWGDLDIQLQRTLTFRHAWRHDAGFTDELYLHVPWDTVWRLKTLAPDVIISAQLGPRSILSASYKALARKARLVFWLGMSEHTERGRSPLYTSYRKRLLRHCQAAIINGQSGVRYLQELGVESDKIFRCPYATSSTFFERGSDERSDDLAHRLVFVGQLVERKGLIPFLEALRNWGTRHGDRRAEFDIVGSGPLEQRIREFGMPENVRVSLRGPLAFGDLPEAYAKAGILAFPTLADDWGMVVNEALAMGVPVLGSRYAQAVEDLCVDGETGWTFRPDAGHEMENALEAALSASPETLNHMRRAARQRVSDLTPASAADIMHEAVLHALEDR